MNSEVRVLVYIRVSTLKQAYEDRKRDGVRIEDGSLEVQKKRAIEYINHVCSQIDKPYRIVSIIEDTKSAKNTDRVGYQILQDAIESGQVDWIVTSEISRLHRNTLEFLNFKMNCKQYNVELLFVGSPYGQKDDSTDLMETMMAAMAEFERKQTATRLRRNIKSRLKTDGKINGAEPILGLDRCSERRGHFVINNEEVKSLIRLLEIYLNSTGVADAINQAHAIGLKDKAGREFTKQRFNNILKNVEWRYAGRWYLKEANSDDLNVIQLDHGEVINGELRKCVLDRIKEHSQRNIKRGKHNHVYLLSGLLKSSTGNSFSGQIGHGNGGDYRYYYCREHQQRVNADTLEELIEKKVINYFKRSEQFQKLVTSGFKDRDNKVNALKFEITELKTSLTRIDNKTHGLINLLTNPDLSSESLKLLTDQLNEFQAQKTGILAMIRDKEIMVGHFLSLAEVTTAKDKIERYAKEVKNLNRIEKRKLLETIFEKIEVLDPYLIKLHLKRPSIGVLSHSSVENGCGKGRSGGTNRT